MEPLEQLRQRCRAVEGLLVQLSLDGPAIEAFADQLSAAPPPLPRWDHPAFPREAGPQLDTVVLLGNALNFSYFVAPHEAMWAVELAPGRTEVDAFALFGALRLCLEEGLDLADGAVLQSEAIGAVFARGKGVLPMLGERIAILAELGQILCERFGGRLETAIATLGNDCPDFAVGLAELFPSFRDERKLGPYVFPLLKRAQLAAGMLHAARIARGAPGMTRPEALSLYADYMLPRALRHLGILRYGPELARRVDGGLGLEAGSPGEVQLRIATVLAGERILEACTRRGLSLTALALDFALWRAGFEANRPHHETRTTDY